MISHLNCWYNSTQVLFDVAATMEEGSITALIGPSGCGKSTLLRSINRMNDLVRHARIDGSILYEGNEILSPAIDVVNLRRKIGMVFQKANPFPMTIFENVAYGLRIAGVNNKRQLEAVVKESLIKADLWEEVCERLQFSAFRLSGGQQQRLCIARALAIKPDVLLLDEPCSALDPIATAKIEELLTKLARETTIIIVTHNMHQARRISDSTVYMLGGRIIESGSTKELFSHPSHEMTRKYIQGEFG